MGSIIYVKQLDVGSNLKVNAEAPDSEFSDGPPCIETLAAE